MPPIAEVQVALEQAVVNVTGLNGADVKTRMRTGTVATTDNRNWELRYDELFERLNQQRAIAVDMESATIAANGFRFRVPYGTLLCVSDKPLHGELKLRGMANTFYRERINQHLKIGLEAIRILRDEIGPDAAPLAQAPQLRRAGVPVRFPHSSCCSQARLAPQSARRRAHCSASQAGRRRPRHRLPFAGADRTAGSDRRGLRPVPGGVEATCRHFQLQPVARTEQALAAPRQRQQARGQIGRRADRARADPLQDPHRLAGGGGWTMPDEVSW